MKKLLLLLLILVASVNANAQKEKVTSVKSVRGEFSVVLSVADITGREAGERAREDAKRKALEQVCGSRINIWDQMETSSVGDSFNSLAVNQIDGEILEFDIKEEGQAQSARPGEVVFYCIADVKVKKGLSPDPDFIATVSGVQSVYFTGNILKFDVTPSRDCYMKVFLFEDATTGYMLYPNKYDRPRVFTANTRVDITDSPDYEFELTKDPEKKKELNRLVFVFTKTERPFSEQVTSRSEIEKWIAGIPNDQKYLQFAIFEIRDN
jgi:hypothetical protein